MLLFYLFIYFYEIIFDLKFCLCFALNVIKAEYKTKTNSDRKIRNETKDK